MWLALLTAALAVPLSVEVVPDPPPVRGARLGPGPRPAVAFAEAEIVVDGDADAAWLDVPQAPPLVPREEGPAAPGWRPGVALGAEQLVVKLPPTPDQHTQVLVLDPDGLRTDWWVVTLGPEHVHAERCGFVGFEPIAPVSPPTRAAPCEDVTLPVGRGVVEEVAFPRERLDTSARLLWYVVGPGGTGGSWGPWGRIGPRPELGRPLAIDRGEPPRVETEVGRAGRLVWGVWLPGGDTTGTWRWEVWRHGGLGASGDALVVAGEERAADRPPDVPVPIPRAPQAMVRLRAPAPRGGLPHAWVVPRGRPETRVQLVDPLDGGDPVVVRYASPVDVTWRVGLRDARGHDLGEPVSVAVPAGEGRLLLHGGEASEAAMVVVRGTTVDARLLRAP